MLPNKVSKTLALLSSMNVRLVKKGREPEEDGSLALEDGDKVYTRRRRRSS